MTSARFSVDTHLFRELGELLVGRDSTALVELIKNSYDADASRVSVFGENLGDSELGAIVVTDDGNGMTPTEFTQGFLRIASRSKEGGERRSPRLRRRFTGQKGVGRLAAHKLARRLDVVSIPLQNGAVPPGVEARIDWDAIEAFDALDDVDESALTVQVLRRKRSTQHGTEIRLTRLRRAWTERQRGLFLREVAGFSPPTLLVEASSEALPCPLFPEGITTRDVMTDAGLGFEVSLEGDFATGDEYFTASPASVSWILEIDGLRKGIRVAIAPTPREEGVTPNARARSFELDRGSAMEHLRFVARILIHEGSREGIGAVGQPWPSHLSGIRVYMEGFRVLPYGEPSDDWLGLDAMYKRRAPTLGRLQDSRYGNALEREAQSSLGNASYLGAIFLTEAGSPGLQMLVNREGFLLSAEFDALAELIGVCVDLSTRTRAAASEHRRVTRRTQRRVNAQTHTPMPSPEQLAERVDEMTGAVASAQVHASQGELARAMDEMTRATEIATEVSAVAIDLSSEQSMLRVLASLGTQMSGFIHEVNGLLALAQRLEPMIATELKGRSGVRAILTSMTELRRGLERQASYLLDVVTPDARRRRSAQPLAIRFAASTALVSLAAARRDVAIHNEIPDDVRTPPMFRAELTAVLANLLTNAVKNAGSPGNIRATGEIDEENRLFLRIENTGVAVDPTDGERWFEPFESTTTEIDAALGQGMGLGLPITRAMITDYGGTIGFVRPSKGYTAAIQVTLPKGRRT